MTMLTKIGNSQGIRIPKPIIKQANLENSEIEFEVTKDGLLLKPVKKVSRKDWEKNIKEVLSKNTQEDEAVLQEWLDEPLDEWEW
jgi:antitoxin MazE